ncbi:hypothetical protein Tco_1385516 [Tanacetum coccineum]
MKDLNNHIAFLKKTFETIKQDSSKRYEKNITEIVDLEKTKKELETIVFKVGQSAQTMHMLIKPQIFYDETHKTDLGNQNPLYLSQARRQQPALYNGNVLIDKRNPVSVSDSKETLILVEESRLKMLEKQTVVNTKPIDYSKLNKLYEFFVPQTQLSAEQLYWSSIPSPPFDECIKRRTTLSPHEIGSWEQSDIKGRVSSTNASGSKPKSNTKNDRIPQPSSRSMKNKVEAHHRKFKSSANKNNHVLDCNANDKNVALSKNSDTICLSCNECLFSVNHDACVV